MTKKPELMGNDELVCAFGDACGSNENDWTRELQREILCRLEPRRFKSVLEAVVRKPAPGG